MAAAISKPRAITSCPLGGQSGVSIQRQSSRQEVGVGRHYAKICRHLYMFVTVKIVISNSHRIRSVCDKASKKLEQIVPKMRPLFFLSTIMAMLQNLIRLRSTPTLMNASGKLTIPIYLSHELHSGCPFPAL